jgi:hypothetical protein
MRAVAFTVPPLAAYAVIYHDVVSRRFLDQCLGFLLGLGVFVAIAAWIFAPRRDSAWIPFGIAAPFFGSITGYLVMFVASYLQHGSWGAGMPLASRAAIALFFPYFACNVWTLSIALPVFGIVGSKLFELNNTTAPHDSK